MSRENDAMEMQRRMKVLFAQTFAEAVRKGEIKKPDPKSFLVGYLCDDDGDKVKLPMVGHLCDDNGNRIK